MNRKVIGALAIICILIGCFVVAGQYGYIVDVDSLSVLEPTGNAEEIKEREEQEEIAVQCVNSFIKDTPAAEKVKYSIFRTDASRDSIYTDYKSRLENQGYTEKLEYSGNIECKGIKIRYFSFTKGLTGVVFGVCAGGGGNTIVIYSTGSVLDYMEMIKHYRM